MECASASSTRPGRSIAVPSSVLTAHAGLFLRGTVAITKAHNLLEHPIGIAHRRIWDSGEHTEAMDRTAVKKWVADYERAWRTPGTELLADLFAPQACYLPSPWAQPLKGLEAVAAFWESERSGPDEEFTMSSEVVTLDADTAVVRVMVNYGATRSGPWRDLWVLHFAQDGRCSSFEEWPFAPDQPDGHEPSPPP